MTNQFALTDDQIAIQEMAQKFTADAITPHAGEWDAKKHFPVDVIKRTAELGFGGIYVRSIGRYRAGTAGGGDHHGGDGLWLSGDIGVYLDPQYGGVDD